MDLRLHPSSHQGVAYPVVLVILDGVGLYRSTQEGYPGNAVALARTPNLDHLLTSCKLRTRLKAHGLAVGLPSDEDQGNSEVGHNAIGAGRIFHQGAALVNAAIADGRIFAEGSVFDRYASWAKEKNKAVHLIGLLSDGNVHSHINQLFALIAEYDKRDIEQVYIHVLHDGRDVPPISALQYIGQLEDFLFSLKRTAAQAGKHRDYAIASGGGRMVTTMDRYRADWSIVQRGYNVHVLGKGPLFPDAFTAVRALRASTAQTDQYLPEWVIHQPDDSHRPLAAMHDDDVIIFFNFRGDRAIEISLALTEESFTQFDRGYWPRVKYAGMMQYDGDLKIPPNYLVEPPAIDKTVSEYLARSGISQLAISETQKFGHVTYFWNGNNSEPFDRGLETWIEIPSDKVAFDAKPDMQAREVTARVIEELPKGHQFIRINYANGDMVGHTGNLQAAIQAISTVDSCLGQLIAAVDALGGTLIVTADHGNSEMMIEVDAAGKPKGIPGNYKPMVSHTKNPVPFVIKGPDLERFELNPDIVQPGLANIAATILMLMGFEKPDSYEPSLIRLCSR